MGCPPRAAPEGPEATLDDVGRRPLRHLLLPLLVVISLLTVVRGQQVAICRDWQECRQLALEASAQGEYERFHDLAWRAVQTGPKNDSALMYLLARAQVLSGRPHDALVMLQRLADMGVATDAATDAAFTRTRALPGWPEVAAAMARAARRPRARQAAQQRLRVRVPPSHPRPFPFQSSPPRRAMRGSSRPRDSWPPGWRTMWCRAGS